MSHFTVLVIGENPEEQLAPFQENNMGDCPEQYLTFTEDDDCDVDEKTGKKGYWKNPNAKWDWYLLGGRWTGFFKLKEAVQAVVGEPGIMISPPEPGRGDTALKSEIDFDAMRDEAGNSAAKDYDFALSIIKDHPVNKTWAEVRGSHVGDIQGARAFYWDQPRCAAWQKVRSEDFKSWPLSYDCSPDDFLITRDEYIQSARNSAIATHAVIKDGKWYERGEMGWFAMVSNEKESDQWNKEFSDLLDSLPDDTILSVYDCHI